MATLTFIAGNHQFNQLSWQSAIAYHNRNRIVIVPCGEVRRFGDHGLDAMMSRANVRDATSSFSPHIKSRDQG